MSDNFEQDAPCGCKIGIRAGYDWVDEHIEIEEVYTISTCPRCRDLPKKVYILKEVEFDPSGTYYSIVSAFYSKEKAQNRLIELEAKKPNHVDWYIEEVEIEDE